MLIAVFLISSLFAGQGYAVNELVRGLVQGGNDFGGELYQELSKEHDSFVSSPISANMALAMLLFGAEGDMYQKMASVLRVQPDNRNLVEDGYEALTKTFLERERNVTLEMANKLYVDDQNQVKVEYQEALKTILMSEVEPVNFKNEDEVLANVNDWVKSATHEKIDKIIEEVSPDAVAIGLNAVYFYGQWKVKFNPDDTKEAEFHLDSKSSTSVPMMSLSSDQLLFGTYHDADVLKLYYTGEDTSMLILLPREVDGLAKLEATLPDLNITEISNSLDETTVNVIMPKFKIESALDLQEPLKRMGLEELFQFSRDFRRIVDREFKISYIMQKAYIEVTEEGTEAAAVTEGGVGHWTGLEWEVEYTADHPFMFIILDELTGGSLFMGRYTGI